jgi:hypothetical protein
MAKVSLQTRYWRVITRELRKANLTIDRSASDALRDFVDAGITKLRGKYTPPSAEDLNGAELKLRLFASELVAQCQGQETAQVTNDILDTVKKYLCPLYPFC